MVGSSRIRRSGSSSRAAAGDQHQPLPAARQGAEALIGDLRRDADLVEQHVDAPVLAAQPDAFERGAQHLAHRLPGQPLGNILRQAADAQAPGADDLAGVQLELAGQALQQGGLAGAVLADQRRARVVEQERHVLEDARLPRSRNWHCSMPSTA